MGDHPDASECAHKVEHTSCTPALPCYFFSSQLPPLGLTCCIFCILSFVLHAWQEPFKSRFPVLQLLISIARLLLRFESVCRWLFKNLGHVAHAG